ncbi:NADH-quinone oxidoreductase subunit D [Desulfurispirillum indicum]|uniref:NADH-quinone oxidoreductase subunit D n=1 Tax=Desulfurispirillum indicum (strain ATCC BAA-1389 / DSM 22839 / S5) TaxID=653733 RepID=E6W125_DESIS|nr:NADH-quinone oxidoreductase subunit D [Desulfurispirillum indicum]ADU65357.1 NADH dehydrogenase (quinone) [Desulfurispirillum indicum S5]UCZ57252.1 NADH-quinone oxidoreductase subunit D [Desulfurispirillum indicum]
MTTTPQSTLAPALFKHDYESDLMTLAMGPHHPSTHGVLQIMLKLDGEVVVEAEPVIGFLHRSMERMGQERPWIQYTAALNRVDYLATIHSEVPYCVAAERIAGLEVPERAQWLRVLMMELNRIHSHLLWVGTFLLDMGATTIVMYSLRERELILDIMEEVTGMRMMNNYTRIGGVRYDMTPNSIEKTREFIKSFPQALSDMEAIITGNPIVRGRLIGKGLLTKQQAIDFGAMGPISRASGVDFDLRRDRPDFVYDKLDFKVPVFQEGDNFARYMVRMEEMKESLRMVEQCLDMMPEGPVKVEKPKIGPMWKAPAGEAYAEVESARGILGTYVVSDGSGNPMRTKLRGASFSNLHAFAQTLVGINISEVVILLGTYDVVLPEIDR